MMFRFLPYQLKTLWRHRTRTLLTVSGLKTADIALVRPMPAYAPESGR